MRLMCMLAVLVKKKLMSRPFSTTVEGDMVLTSRFMENIMAPPFLAGSASRQWIG